MYSDTEHMTETEVVLNAQKPLLSGQALPIAQPKHDQAILQPGILQHFQQLQIQHQQIQQQLQAQLQKQQQLQQRRNARHHHRHHKKTQDEDTPMKFVETFFHFSL